ncbi:MAG TPA: hypothetical protein VK509_12945 [Polyangiales bacterium]|nr:hypothetical protein [Polyangiales bacterium]
MSSILRQARCSLGLPLRVLCVCLLACSAACLVACDDTAEPRPPQPDAAISGHGGQGGAGSGGAGSGGAGGSSGNGGCSASAPPLSPASLPAAALGEPYAQELSIVGTTASQVGWTVRGLLPSGLMLVEDNRELPGPPPEAHAMLTGTPTATGTFRFTLSASLLVQPSCSAPPAQRDYELKVSEELDAGAP